MPISNPVATIRKHAARPRVPIVSLAPGKSISPGSDDAGDFADFLGHPDFVLSLARGLKVMEAFDGLNGGGTVAELASRTGLSRAAVRRILVTLTMLGYVEPYGQGHRLHSRVLRTSAAFFSCNSMASTAQVLVDQLTAQVRESCSVCVLDGDDIVFVARAIVARLRGVRNVVGSRMPAYCTSLGRVLLAGLSDQELTAYMNRVTLKPLTPKTVVDKKVLTGIIRQVRKDGFAVLDEEIELGMRSIAVPVKNAGGQTIAAMHIGVRATHASKTELVQRFLPTLRDYAHTLGRLL
jgi:IclR family pca regulon transcriptional regulator